MKPKFLIILAVAFMLVATAQIQEGFSWSAECNTTWNGVGWNGCIAYVIADLGGYATLKTTAPACSDSAGQRYSKCGHGLHGLRYAYCSDEGDEWGTDACCRTNNFKVSSDSTYWVQAYNASSVQECGPTTGKIQSGIVNCQGS